MSNNSISKYSDSTNRVLYFDWLRILATLMIVMIHNMYYSENLQLVEWSIVTIYDSVTRWGVPVFVMISGALFLGRHQPISIVLKKNISRILSAFLFWSILYTVWGIIFSDESQSIKGVVVSILNGHYHMWFLYMIVCLYLIVPFLEEIIKM